MNRHSVASVLLGLIAGVAFGQAPSTDDSTSSSKLVNLDTDLILAPGTASVGGAFRVFGGNEKQPYGSFDLNAGLIPGLDFVFRSTFSKVSTFEGSGFNVRFGGDDFEALLKYANPVIPHFAFMVGVSAVNTPANQANLGSAAAVYDLPIPRGKVYGELKDAFGSHTYLLGFGLGADVALQDGFRVIADITTPLTGKNTYSTDTGNTERDTVYGLALRYVPSFSVPGQFLIDLGVTNGLGDTTGFSLTSSLGSTFGLYTAVTYKF